MNKSEKNKNAYNLSFQKILATLSLTIIIMIIIITALFVISITKYDNRNRESKNYADAVSAVKYFSSLESSVDLFTEAIYAKNSYNSAMNEFLKNPVSKYLKNNFINYLNTGDDRNLDFFEYINNYILKDKNLKNIYLISLVQNQILYFQKSDTNTITIEYFQEYTGFSEEIYKFSTKNKRFFTAGILDNEGNLISHIFPIYDSETFGKVGYFVFQFKKNVIPVSSLNYRDSSGWVIACDSGKEIIFSNVPDKYSGKIPDISSMTENLSQEKYSSIKSVKGILLDNSDSGVYVIGLISSAAKSPMVMMITYIFPVVAFLLIIFYLYIFHYFRKTYGKNISEIIGCLSKIKENDFNLRIDIGNSNNELGMIAFNINSMIDQIQTHIMKDYVHQLEDKKAELKFLQSQINPHFLYNTLEVIRMKAVSEGSKEIEDMTYFLACFLRSSLKTKPVITVKEEIDISKMYLSLFKVRYKHKLNFQFHVEEELYDQKIQKLLFQPMIENYIVHGFDLTRDNNLISVDISKSGYDMVVYITDNGHGIEEDKLVEIRKRMNNNTEKLDHIGLINVNRRMKILYGEKYGIEIDSKRHFGTSIKFTVPLDFIYSEDYV